MLQVPEAVCIHPWMGYSVNPSQGLWEQGSLQPSVIPASHLSYAESRALTSLLDYNAQFSSLPCQWRKEVTSNSPDLIGCNLHPYASICIQFCYTPFKLPYTSAWIPLSDISTPRWAEIINFSCWKKSLRVNPH